MNCNTPDAELPPNGNPHREYCHHAHRQASYRQRKQPVIPLEVQKELDSLRLRNAQLEAELARVKEGKCPSR